MKEGTARTRRGGDGPFGSGANVVKGSAEALNRQTRSRPTYMWMLRSEVVLKTWARAPSHDGSMTADADSPVEVEVWERVMARMRLWRLGRGAEADKQARERRTRFKQSIVGRVKGASRFERGREGRTQDAT